jgi:hypothetical protein
MITKIVAQLKTGTIKTVVPYGYGTAPTTTEYVVVKRESAPNMQWRWRIIAHMKPGSNITLDDYVFKEVPTLLNNFALTTRLGNTDLLSRSDEYSDVALQSDDGTISMERIFYSPHILF